MVQKRKEGVWMQRLFYFCHSTHLTSGWWARFVGLFDAHQSKEFLDVKIWRVTQNDMPVLWSFVCRNQEKRIYNGGTCNCWYIEITNAREFFNQGSSHVHQKHLVFVIYTKPMILQLQNQDQITFPLRRKIHRKNIVLTKSHCSRVSDGDRAGISFHVFCDWLQVRQKI